MKVWDFEDYREYLASIYERRRVSHPRASSYLAFARRAGLSKTYIRHVLAKERHLRLDHVPAVLRAFHVERDEFQYFTLLVCRNLSQDRDMIDQFACALRGLRASEQDVPGRSPEVSPANRTLFSSALAMIVHSLTRQPQFRANPAWIASRLARDFVSEQEIAEVLSALIRNGSIVQNADGSWQKAPFVYNRAESISNERYRVYHVGLEMAAEAASYPRHYRPGQFVMLSLSYDAATANQAIERVLACRDELISLSKACEKPTQVFFGNLNLSAVTIEPSQLGDREEGCRDESSRPSERA